MVREYCIQPGDDFHRLAQRWGGTCEDYLLANPKVDPLKLQIGQKIVLPEFKGIKGLEQYSDISLNQGQEFVGEYLDHVEMEIEGVRVHLRRVGEPKTPHEIHFLLPRTEIRKIQPAGECGPTEVQIMLSNINVVLSPRLMSGEGDKAEQSQILEQTKEQEQTIRQASKQQTQNLTQQAQNEFGQQYGQGAQPAF
ncbi:hypothetical protein Desor_1017 [Desulfosporosinus orientis DSM 765]|uniref:LysM domain-containing protein n=1 Tax=Desulfosporosinus orientis (strain ATCC 19365 / DSM 765 / NCIMB 8382 / VKM B-1628 / Singapore I) TaxID=768706 RepID=G7W845_DESOD|nr:LysM domain-containing protein [Desulfosporosinus orientis]AET66691.1 hypothetical protein Desor_1017 [Desulfosporosinus orientis DSM 765]